MRVLVAEDNENLGEVLARLRARWPGGGVRIQTVRSAGYRITSA